MHSIDGGKSQQLFSLLGLPLQAETLGEAQQHARFKKLWDTQATILVSLLKIVAKCVALIIHIPARNGAKYQVETKGLNRGTLERFCAQLMKALIVCPPLIKWQIAIK